MEYSASYTAGGILYDEIEALLPLLLRDKSKELLSQEIKESNYLKIASEAARKSVMAEVKKRNRFVGIEFWLYYSNCTEEEKRLLLFYLCVKSYRLIWDFHFKVTVPGFWAYYHLLDADAYKMYLDELGSREERVDKWTLSTRSKLISNYSRMLKDAGLFKMKLQKPEVEPAFYCYFIKQGEVWALDIYFLNQEDKKVITHNCQ